MKNVNCGKKIGALTLLTMVMLWLTIGGVRVNAEETGIDATKATTYTYTIAADKTGILVPISFSKVGIYTYKIETANFSTTVHANLLKNATVTNVKDMVDISTFSGTEKEYSRIVAEPVTYYLFVYSDNPPAVEKTVKVTCTYHEPDTAGRQISAGETVKAVAMDTLYYSFKLKNDSAVTITGDGVNLCDSKKNSLNVTSTQNKAITTYLKKGTYYLEVSDGLHTFKYTAKKQTLGKNTTKKKATAIKLGKSVNLKFVSTNKKQSVLYYKFTLKKAKKITVTADPSKLLSSGTLEMIIVKNNSSQRPYLRGSISGKKGKVAFSGLLTKGNKNLVAGKKSIKLPAGTYYLAVNNTSGGGGKITVK